MFRPALVLVALAGPLLFRFYQTRPIYKAGDRIKITATLRQTPTITTPETGPQQQKFTLTGINIYAPLYPEFHYGDRIRAIGTVRQGQSGFWLKTTAPLQLVNSSSHPLSRLRHRLHLLILTFLPQPESSLVAGMTLGSKNLPPAFYQSLKKSGTLHVVVASGANIALIAGPALNTLVLFLRRRTAALLTLFLIWTYVLIVGFDAPIIRAGIMGSLAFLGLILGKKSWAWWSLFLAAYLMLLVSPPFLSDVGFQLSFLATAGILLLTGPLSRLFHFLPRFVRESWSTTLAAQVGTFPVMIFTFHQFQPHAPFVNAALLWTVSPITILGLLSLLVGLIFPPAGQAIAYLAYPLAFYFTKLVSIF